MLLAVETQSFLVKVFSILISHSRNSVTVRYGLIFQFVPLFSLYQRIKLSQYTLKGHTMQFCGDFRQVE